MNSFNFVIRDAVAADVDACLALDHSYESEHVWRMVIQTTGDDHHLSFQKERLPRAKEVVHESDEIRLRLALPREICYLVAQAKDEPTTIPGYLTLRPDPVHKIALIQDIVVSRPFRRSGIGTRLLNVARRWATEHGAQQLMVEVSTNNYPAIQFLQTQGLRFCGFNDQYFRNQDIAIFFGQALH